MVIFTQLMLNNFCSISEDLKKIHFLACEVTSGLTVVTIARIVLSKLIIL